MKLLALVLLSALLVYSCSLADEIEYFCGFDQLPDGIRTQAVISPSGGPYTFKGIYISFNECGENGYIEDEERALPYYHNSLFTAMAEFLRAASHDSFQVFYETIVNPASPDTCWIAARPLRDYVNNVNPQYGNFTSTEWAEVNAEIFFRIQQVYADSNLTDPFEGCDGLFFIHRYRVWGSGMAGIVGTGLVNTNIHTGMTVTINTGLWGTGFFSLNDMRFIALHEFGHILGLGHAPAAPVFGPYAVMRQSVLRNCGFVPFNYEELHYLGWLPEQPTVVQAETESIQLFDLHSASGSYIKVRLEPFGGQLPNEYLNLTYHSGLDGGTYLSKGISVWHTIENLSGSWIGETWDFEQAEGRYVDWNYDPDQGAPTGTPNPISGLDRMNIRHGTPANFHAYYRGHAEDFFPVANDSITEFSYRTNPSTYGSAASDLLAPQSVITSLVILATRDDDNNNVELDILSAPREKIISIDPEEPINLAEGDSVVFTFDNYFYSEECPDWMQECNIINTVTVSYNPHGDSPWLWEPIIENIPYVVPLDGNMAIRIGHEDFSEYHYTDTGRLRFEFGNTLTGIRGISHYPGNVVVNGFPVPRELLIAPAGGDKLAANIGYPVKWTRGWSNDPRVEINQIDFYVSQNSGLTYSLVDTNISYVVDADGLDTYLWAPDLPVVNDQVRIKLGFHWQYAGDPSPSLYNEAELEDDILIYILDAKLVDKTTAGFPDYEQITPFLGMPSGVVNIKVGAQASDAVLVGIAGGTGATEGKLFLNLSDANDLSFEDRTIAYLPDQMLAVGLGPIAVADYDQDGKDDFFAFGQNNQPSRLYRQGATSFVDVSAGAFGDLNLEQIAHASWIDVNHDGTSVLYLGRKSDGTGNDRNILLQYGDDSFSELMGTGLDFGFETTTVAWADYSNAGDWAVAIGTVAGLVVYQANEAGVYINQGALSLPAQKVLSVHWADFNRDNRLDLLVLFEGTSIGVHPEAVVLYNDGNSISMWRDPDYLPTQGRAVRHAIPVDYDLDGWIDVLLYTDDGDAPLLLANQRHLDGWASGWHDVANETGLLLEGLQEHRIGALLIGDFDGDGDLDLFVGREDAAAGTLFRNEQFGGLNSPKNSWLGFDLMMEANTMPSGAMVSLSAPGQSLGTKVVDAGGGVHQSPRRLIFGLGDSVGPFDVSIRWPDRQVSNIQVTGTNQLIRASLGFEMMASTFSSHIEYKPSEDTYDWVFFWETDYWTEPVKDRIEITLHSGVDCEIGENDTLVLNDGTGAVVNKVVFDASKNTYVHELRWTSRPCHPFCSYRVDKVESALGTVSRDFAPSGKYRFIGFTYCAGQL